MTIDQIRASKAPFLTPAQAAKILQCDPHVLRITARENRDRLGFPVICVGNRVKIPREPFLHYVAGDPIP